MFKLVKMTVNYLKIISKTKVALLERSIRSILLTAIIPSYLKSASTAREAVFR